MMAGRMAGGPRGASPSAGTSAAAPAAPVAKVASIDLKKMRTLVENMVSEYVDIRSMDEVKAHVDSIDEKFLDVAKVRSTLVDVCVGAMMEKKDKEREAVPLLLVELFKLNKLTTANFVGPLKEVLEFMPDIKVDVPLAEKHLSTLLAHLFHNTSLSVGMLPDTLPALFGADPSKVLGVVKSFLSALVEVDAAKGIELYKAAKPDFAVVVPAEDKDKLVALLSELGLSA